MSNDPTTPDEWQAAVDAADFLLLIDSARQYGLITGGDDINVDRCVELLDRAGVWGIFPTRPDRRRVWLARWLRFQREELGITQRAIAERAGISQSWLSAVEQERADVTAPMCGRLRATIEAIREERGQ